MYIFCGTKRYVHLLRDKKICTSFATSNFTGMLSYKIFWFVQLFRARALTGSEKLTFRMEEEDKTIGRIAIRILIPANVCYLTVVQNIPSNLRCTATLYWNRPFKFL